MITPRHRSSTADVAAHYDELDAFYRDVWGEHVHHGLWRTGRESPECAVEQLVETVAHHARLGAGHAVCDVGCGYGATARLLSERYDAQVTALTLSEAQHAYACSVMPGASNPMYLCRDWLDNGLTRDAFDAVIAIESTAHMADKARAIEEAAHVLKPGGRLVICAWLAADAPLPWQVRHLLEPICAEGCLPDMGTADEYATWIERAGLSLECFDDLTRQVRRTWPICLRRTAARLVTRPAYARYLFDCARGQRAFLLTMLRIWIAYHTGAMRYGLFAASKPSAVSLST